MPATLQSTASFLLHHIFCVWHILLGQGWEVIAVSLLIRSGNSYFSEAPGQAATTFTSVSKAFPLCRGSGRMLEGGEADVLDLWIYSCRFEQAGEEEELNGDIWVNLKCVTNQKELLCSFYSPVTSQVWGTFVFLQLLCSLPPLFSSCSCVPQLPFSLYCSWPGKDFCESSFLTSWNTKHSSSCILALSIHGRALLLSCCWSAPIADLLLASLWWVWQRGLHLCSTQKEQKLFWALAG